ncbi:hypothetical protein Tco_0627998 [Tanacetum coccineum]|uniref:Xylulose kinase-1 n=1 Tax=Tanacetum coccineum TaxID=301880 RepID=A0ABQ4WP11_9ASTR
MANLEFCDKHNMVAYLEKSEGSGGFHEIIDFLSASHIHYALTASPTIYTSLIEQFWQTAALCIIDEGVLVITETIDRKVKITVSEASNRRLLKLEDSEGIPSLPTAEIFEQLALMGASSTSQPPITPTEEAALMPHESPLHSVHSLRRDEGTQGYARRRARIVISKDEDAAKDSSKQWRKISDIDTDPTILLVQPQQDMEFDFDATASIPVTTTGLEISTANRAVSIVYAAVTTVSAFNSTVSPPRVSTAKDISGAETLVYIRRSASKAKDKGKAIIQESELPKKIKKREARFKAEQEQERRKLGRNMCMYLKNQGGYKMSHFKGISYEEIRPIFERVWDQIQSFVPMDSGKEKGSEKKSRGRRKKSLARKRARETLSEESAKKQKLRRDDIEKTRNSSLFETLVLE